MKLIHTLSASDVFGPEKTVINECVALRAAGWDCRIVNFWDSDEIPLAAKVRAAGVPYHGIVSRRKFDVGAIRTFVRLLRAHGRPLVHSHGYKADLYSLLAARLARAPVVSTVHGWTSENAKVRVYEQLQAFLWRYFDRVVCVSESYRALAARAGTRAEKLVVVHNGIMETYLKYSQAPQQRDRARAELGLAPDDIVVASIGRLGIEKGHHLLLEAAVRVLPACPRARFLIIGEGAERADIEARIAELDVGSAVRLLGHRDDLPAIYPALDVLAITSLREGLPNVLLEAMLNGIPAVATAVGGIPEVVREGHDGLLVAPGDGAAYARALAMLLADAGMRRRLGEQARVTVRARFLFERRLERMCAIYASFTAPAANPVRGGL